MRITKPRTQRRRMYQAPAHIRHRFFSAPLSPDLKKKHYTNAIPVKTGDTIRVMRGDRKGFEGKIIRVSRKKHRIYVEGVTREKVDGTSIPIPLHPSKVMVVTLNLDDKWRRESLKRKTPPEIMKPQTPMTEEEIDDKKEIEKTKKTRKGKTRKKTTKSPLSKTKTSQKTGRQKRKRSKKMKASGVEQHGKERPK